MQREIKFRFWGLNDEEWLDPSEIEFEYQDIDHEFIGVPFSLYQKKIIYSQFTGLKDKNGIDIYEGDIVSFCLLDSDLTPNYKGKVEWFRSGWFINCEFLGLTLSNAGKPEVIGNIFENSELLIFKS